MSVNRIPAITVLFKFVKIDIIAVSFLHFSVLGALIMDNIAIFYKINHIKKNIFKLEF